ncbi:hypothetical protein BDR07DRAFT_623855 [Suillus spraguei]|nr:hypothetical protein BDR07DRAFT_623855 [Suillus spraguei]
MYQRSRKILIFLIVTFLAINIFDGVTAIMSTMQTSSEELILSGAYLYLTSVAKDISLPYSIAWILYSVGGPHIMSHSLDCGKTPP